MMRREATVCKKGITEWTFTMVRDLVRVQAVFAVATMIYGAIAGWESLAGVAVNFVTESLGMLLVMEVVSFLLPIFNALITRGKK